MDIMHPFIQYFCSLKTLLGIIYSVIMIQRIAAEIIILFSNDIKIISIF